MNRNLDLQEVQDQPFIISEPIDLNIALHKAHHAKAGAVVLFSGEVRNHHEGQSVAFLEYETQAEMAQSQMRKIVEEATAKWGLHFVFCQHRIGKVELTESAVVVVTSGSHRNEAYQANIEIIDRIKSEVAIWKKEYLVDGSGIWK